MWTSDAYNHYNIKLERTVPSRTGTSSSSTNSASENYLTFIFGCKYQNPTHHDVRRLRQKTSNGTTTLTQASIKCNTARGVAPVIQSTSKNTTVPYSPAMHRTLFAMQCATSERPFGMINDKYGKLIVQCLRPGAEVFSASTVSRDVKMLYGNIASMVKKYFVVGFFFQF